MRYVRIVATVLILGFSPGLSVNSQTPQSAVHLYGEGLKKLEKHDLDGAIDCLSRSIKISSSPSGRAQSRSLDLSDKYGSSADADIVSVIDPLTAKALTARGVAYFRKEELDRAIADFDKAIMINPGLAEAYLDRGVARRAKRDLKGS